MTSKQYSIFILIKSTDSKIGDTGATSLSDALRLNTTLTQLDLSCEDKRNNTQMTPINNPLFFILIKSTGSDIGDKGATSFSDALKSNTTLTVLFLNSERKRNNTNGIHQTLYCFHSHTINREQDWRQRSNIIG